jgi:peptidoglycan/xylan/chitin deacetylase (PgdA/CDA1 family)
MLFKRAMKRAAVAAGGWMSSPDPSTRRVVFCYHSVHPHRRPLATTPDLFARHIEWMKQHCRIVSLTDLVTDTSPNQSGKPMATITFDDGYEDNHSYALPILARQGVPATFFVTAGFIEQDSVVVARFHHLAGGAEHAVPLAWTQVRELCASGMGVGSHTYSHPNLARLSPSAVRDELVKSRDIICDRVGGAVDLFAYPFGKPRVHFTSLTAAAVRAAGHRIAAAVTFRGVRTSDSPLSVPRFFTDGDSISKLEAKLRGNYELVGWWQEHAPLAVMRSVSPEDFER